MLRSLPVLLVLSVFACGSRPAPRTPVPLADEGDAVVAAPEARLPAGHMRGRVHALFEECSGLGGLHVIFEILDERGARVALAHHGGHGFRAPERYCVGDEYEVEYRATARADEDHDGNPDSSRAGWCLGGMPAVGGFATPVARLSPAPQPTRSAGVELYRNCEPRF
jgi:hypothetical protein